MRSRSTEIPPRYERRKCGQAKQRSESDIDQHLWEWDLEDAAYGEPTSDSCQSNRERGRAPPVPDDSEYADEEEKAGSDDYPP